MKRNRQEKIFKLIISSIFLFSIIFSFIPDSQAVIYIYDDLNRLSAAVYEDGKSLRYEYDASGNLAGTKFAEIDERLSNVIRILRVLTGMNEEISLASLDANEDGKIALDDAIHLLQVISGIRN